MSNTLVFANFDQTSEEKCMFFSFSGNYFFYYTGELVVLAQQSRRKKGKERKADKLRANDLPVILRKNYYPVYYLHWVTS